LAGAKNACRRDSREAAGFGEKVGIEIARIGRKNRIGARRLRDIAQQRLFDGEIVEHGLNDEIAGREGAYRRIKTYALPALGGDSGVDAAD